MNTIGFAINVFIGWWILPFALTLIMLGWMLRPLTHRKDSPPCYYFDWNGLLDGIAGLFRLFWIIPILFVWVVYFGVKLWLIN